MVCGVSALLTPPSCPMPACPCPSCLAAFPLPPACATGSFLTCLPAPTLYAIVPLLDIPSLPTWLPPPLCLATLPLLPPALPLTYTTHTRPLLPPHLPLPPFPSAPFTHTHLHTHYLFYPYTHYPTHTCLPLPAFTPYPTQLLSSWFVRSCLHYPTILPPPRLLQLLWTIIDLQFLTPFLRYYSSPLPSPHILYTWFTFVVRCNLRALPYHHAF